MFCWASYAPVVCDTLSLIDSGLSKPVTIQEHGVAYAGPAMFGKTISVEQPAGINRAARLAGRSTPTAHKTIDRAREEWTAIAVPAIVTEQTFARAEQRLADNKRSAARNTKMSSLLQGLTACAGCGYAYWEGHRAVRGPNYLTLQIGKR